MQDESFPALLFLQKSASQKSLYSHWLGKGDKTKDENEIY